VCSTFETDSWKNSWVYDCFVIHIGKRQMFRSTMSISYLVISVNSFSVQFPCLYISIVVTTIDHRNRPGHDNITKHDKRMGWLVCLIVQHTQYMEAVHIFKEYETAARVYMLWYKHDGSCRAWEKFKRNTRRSRAFLGLLECSTTSRVFMSQYIDTRHWQFYIAFIKHF
jgi:hypothetical protein